MKKGLNWFLKKELIIKDESYKPLSNRFLEKSRKNLILMNIIFEINDNEKIKIILGLNKDYNNDEWVVIAGYYSMYAAALALLAKLGYKSKNHTATILALEEFFIKQNLLSNDYLLSIQNASLKINEIENLSSARDKREIAQYSITERTTRDIAFKVRKDAVDFVNKCEEMVKK